MSYCLMSDTAPVCELVKQACVDDVDETSSLFIKGIIPAALQRDKRSVCYDIVTLPVIVCSDAPEAPENLQASDIHADHMKLSWLPPTDDGGSEITGPL